LLLFRFWIVKLLLQLPLNIFEASATMEFAQQVAGQIQEHGDRRCKTAAAIATWFDYQTNGIGGFNPFSRRYEEAIFAEVFFNLVQIHEVKIGVADFFPDFEKFLAYIRDLQTAHFEVPSPKPECLHARTDFPGFKNLESLAPEKPGARPSTCSAAAIWLYLCVTGRRPFSKLISTADAAEYGL